MDCGSSSQSLGGVVERGEIAEWVLLARRGSGCRVVVSVSIEGSSNSEHIYLVQRPNTALKRS